MRQGKPYPARTTLGLKLRVAIALFLLFISVASQGAESLNDLCPDATAILSATKFPENAPPDLSKGSATIGFTIGVDGSVFDVVVHSSTDPSFGDLAVDAVAKLPCKPQISDKRVRLPVDFVRPITPLAMATNICSNYHSVMRKLGYPRVAYENGLESGEVVIDFKLTSEGDIPEFYVMRSTHESFTATALKGLAQLKCKGLGRDVRVRVPFRFRME